MSTRILVLLPVCLGLFSTFSHADEFDRISCQNMVRVHRRSVEPSYSLDIRLKELHYRITVAMTSPSSDKSPVVAQVLWSNGLRDAAFESYLVERLKQSFNGVQTMDMGQFVRAQASTVDRKTFHAAVKKFQEQLRNRVSSPSKIHSNLTPQSRSASAEVREAAHLMLGLLRRNRVSSVEADLDKVLSRSHSRLVREMTERELRFFDYDLFGEVLTYEKDLLMQSIAQKAAGQVDRRDLDYMAIHDEIRKKFIQIARKQVEALRFRETPYLDRIKRYVRTIIEDGETILNRKDKAPALPFNEEGLHAFANQWGNRMIDIYDSPELLKSLTAVEVLGWSKMDEAWKANQRLRLTPDVRDMVRDEDLTHFTRDNAWSGLSRSRSELEELLKFLDRDQQDFGQNEPANNIRTSGLLSVYVTVVTPGSGGDQGASFLDLGTGVVSSFQHQPRRLNSGRGNQKERFDYDTPEFD